MVKIGPACFSSPRVGGSHIQYVMNIKIKYKNTGVEVEKTVAHESDIRFKVAGSLNSKNSDYVFDQQDDFGVYAREVAVVESPYSVPGSRRYDLRVYPGTSTTPPVARVISLQDRIYTVLRNRGVPGAEVKEDEIGFSMRYQWRGVVITARTWDASRYGGHSEFGLDISIGDHNVNPKTLYRTDWSKGSRIYFDGSYRGKHAPDPDMLVRDFLKTYQEVMSEFNPTGFIREI